MTEWLASFLGEYTPVTYLQTVGELTSEVIPSGLAGVDWHYVFAGVLLTVVVVSFFKIIGGIICRLF